MNNVIRQIKSFLKPDIDQYNQTFQHIMSSNIALVDNVAKYIVRHKGKGLRPLLVLLSARIAGTPNKNTYIVAAIVELLHTATLIHDDVIDNATVRRSFPSVNALWKNKISVLMGDYLLSKSLIGATDTGNIEIMRILAETAKRMSKGELFQIEKSLKLNITEEEYYKLISDKTAALLSACSQLGSITVTDNKKTLESLRLYGENIGIAFQIKDDLLDYEGSQKIVGKAVGADLKEKKITLPLILSFKNASISENKEILRLLKKGATNKDVKNIIEFCNKYGGLEASRDAANMYAQKAKDNIAEFDESLAKKNAQKFVDYIIVRKK